MNMKKKTAIKRNSELDLIEIKNKQIVATGKCPKCGSELKRNLAISGWWQCGEYKQCGFQCFTC